MTVLEYLRGLQGQTFPPLLLELRLKSGVSYYIKNGFRIHDDDPEVIVLRVWDLRAIESDETLLNHLNGTTDRDAWEDFHTIDPNIDQANLWVRITEIEGIMEWHERYWPSRPSGETTVIRGFAHPDATENTVGNT